MTSNIHHDLPNGWAYLFLKDITVDEKNAIKRGPFGSAIKKEYFQPSGYKVYEQQNAIYGNSELGKYFIGENKFKELQDFEVKPGDLIISCSGTIGKIAIVPENAPRGIINQALLKITLEKKIVFPKYFTYLFTSQAVQKTVLDKTRGTAIKNIASVKDLRQIPWPIPPINEQQRIVGKVEELFSFLDAGVNSLNAVQGQLKRYRQAVLKAAFEGKLTQQWRIENIGKIDSAEKLLELIKREKINNPKYKELPSVNPAELPEIPASWSWTRLGELLFLSSERYNPNPSENLPFVGLENIEGGTGKLLGFGKSSETRSTKNRFKKGDLLYGKLRPYLNKVWVADFDGVCSTDILVFNKNSYINNNYLGTFLLNQDFVEYARQHMSGVQHPRISYQALSQYEIPLPPSAEQDEIADKIQQNFLIIERIESELQKFTKQSEVLRQSILKDAFMGKLVPQNPADEPPDKLLERIKAERLSNKSKNINQKELSQYVK